MGEGAALGTSISLIVGNGFVMNWYNHKKVGLDMVYFWKSIARFIPALILPAVVGILVSSFMDLYHWRSLIFFGLVYVLVYCVSMWILGMNEYEKELIGTPFMKMRSKFAHRKS